MSAGVEWSSAASTRVVWKNRSADLGEEAAALAVLSYFFERCDIFEDPGDEP